MGSDRDEGYDLALCTTCGCMTWSVPKAGKIKCGKCGADK